MNASAWKNRRVLIDVHNRYIVEADALAEVDRLTKELALAQQREQTALSFAEQAQKDLDSARIAMETLRALASVNLNKGEPEEDRHGLSKERAEAEAQAWVRKYQELEARLDAGMADSALLAFILQSFSSSVNEWHWLHLTIQGKTPRAALEQLRSSADLCGHHGVLISAVGQQGEKDEQAASSDTES